MRGEHGEVPWTIGAVLVALGSALSSVGACLVGPASSDCLPAPLQVSPEPAVAGKPITVSSGPFECDAEYPSGTWYTLFLTVRGEPPAQLTTVEVASDGAFTTQVVLPATTPLGEADLFVTGSRYDECLAQESCAGYSTLFPVRAP